MRGVSWCEDSTLEACRWIVIAHGSNVRYEHPDEQLMHSLCGRCFRDYMRFAMPMSMTLLWAPHVERAKLFVSHRIVEKPKCHATHNFRWTYTIRSEGSVETNATSDQVHNSLPAKTYTIHCLPTLMLIGTQPTQGRARVSLPYSTATTWAGALLIFADAYGLVIWGIASTVH